MKPTQKKGRFSKVEIHDGKTMDVDYDEELRGMIGLDETEIIEQLSWSFYWAVALPHIESDKEFADNFLSDFSENKDARMKAVYGNARIDRNQDVLLLDLALKESERLKVGGGHSVRMLTAIGAIFRDLVGKEDYRSLEKMAEIMKNKGVKRGNRGGLESNRGRLFQSFCVCHLKLGRLPTKREIRDHAGVSEEGRLDADKDLKRIGLGRLRPS